MPASAFAVMRRHRLRLGARRIAAYCLAPALVDSLPDGKILCRMKSEEK
jgi:hypothetical protein